MASRSGTPMLNTASLEACLRSWENELAEMDAQFSKREESESRNFEKAKKSLSSTMDAERLKARSSFDEIDISLLDRMDKLWSRRKELMIRKLEREYEREKTLRNEAYELEQLHYLDNWTNEIANLASKKESARMELAAAAKRAEPNKPRPQEPKTPGQRHASNHAGTGVWNGVASLVAAKKNEASGQAKRKASITSVASQPVTKKSKPTVAENTPTQPQSTPALAQSNSTPIQSGSALAQSKPTPARRENVSELPKPLTERRITFDEVYQDGQAQYKHYIVEFPTGAGNFYILKCDKHVVHFNRNTVSGAAKHLHSAQHGYLSKEHAQAVHHLGYYIPDCSAARAEQNNAVFLEAIARGYKPLNWNMLSKARRDSYGAHDMGSVGPELESKPEQSPVARRKKALNRPIVAPDDIITDPIPGKLYLAYWDEDDRDYIVMILPWTGLDTVGMPGLTLREAGLLGGDRGLAVPACIVLSAETGEIDGWAPGYESGGHLVTKRSFPVMYFDRSPGVGEAVTEYSGSLGWAEIATLRPFSMENPDMHKIPFVDLALEYYNATKKTGGNEESTKKGRLRRSTAAAKVSTGAPKSPKANSRAHSGLSDDLAPSPLSSSISVSSAESEARPDGTSNRATTPGKDKGTGQQMVKPAKSTSEKTSEKAATSAGSILGPGSTPSLVKKAAESAPVKTSDKKVSASAESSPTPSFASSLAKNPPENMHEKTGEKATTSSDSAVHTPSSTSSLIRKVAENAYIKTGEKTVPPSTESLPAPSLASSLVEKAAEENTCTKTSEKAPTSVESSPPLSLASSLVKKAAEKDATSVDSLPGSTSSTASPTKAATEVAAQALPNRASEVVQRGITAHKSEAAKQTGAADEQAAANEQTEFHASTATDGQAEVDKEVEASKQTEVGKQVETEKHTTANKQAEADIPIEAGKQPEASNQAEAGKQTETDTQAEAGRQAESGEQATMLQDTVPTTVAVQNLGTQQAALANNGPSSGLGRLLSPSADQSQNGVKIVGAKDIPALGQQQQQQQQQSTSTASSNVLLEPAITAQSPAGFTFLSSSLAESHGEAPSLKDSISQFLSAVPGVSLPDGRADSPGAPKSTDSAVYIKQESSPAVRTEVFDVTQFQDSNGTSFKQDNSPFLRLLVNPATKKAETEPEAAVKLVIDPLCIASVTVHPLEAGGSKSTVSLLLNGDNDSRTQTFVFAPNDSMGRMETGRIHARRFCRWIKVHNPAAEYRNNSFDSRKPVG